MFIFNFIYFLFISIYYSDTGLEWAAKFGGRIEAGKRLIRAASVLSRIKREIIKISNRKS
jgi:hypothetical protein